MLNGRRLKVGVTLYIRGGAQSIWENGVFQNCYFLAMLLKRSPLVGEVYLVNGGGGSVEQAGDFLALAPVPVIDVQTAGQTLDVVIEMSAQLDLAWARAFRARGGHLVTMRVANDYVIDIERTMFNLPAGLIVSGMPYSAIWMLPAFAASCASYYEIALRAPVQCMPHLWSPVLLERSLQSAAATFGYTPGRTRWRLAIVEPNLCMVKTSHLPMLIADRAHREDPGMIERMSVYNAMGLKDDARFIQFARSLDLVNHGLASFEPRVPIYEVMNHAEAMVAHHWENGQNYVYYEALYGGYPLIHNSNFIGQCGYRYGDFDCAEGALALRRAFAEHDIRLSDYRREARTMLERLDPESEENVVRYSAALQALYR
ncbi:DUF2827 domain-containing protein [Burkholderia pyrrocinia]